jgi:predicted secreted protein
MKTKTSLIIIGLVSIAAIAAGTVLGVNLMSEKPIEKQTPSTIYCNVEDNNSMISIKKGDQVNLTLQDYGDGGYTWTLVTSMNNSLKKNLNSSTGAAQECLVTSAKTPGYSPP